MCFSHQQTQIYQTLTKIQIVQVVLQFVLHMKTQKNIHIFNQSTTS